MVFCAAGWSPLRSAACKRSHESPHSSPLCFLRLRLVGLASTRSLHCQVPVGSTAPLLVDRSQDRVLPAPHGVLRSHGALTHGVRAAQRVALPPRLRPLLLRPRLVPTDRRFVARPSRFRSRKGHWATARACTGEVNYFHSLRLGPASWSTRASPVHQQHQEAVSGEGVLLCEVLGAVCDSALVVVDSRHAHDARLTCDSSAVTEHRCGLAWSPKLRLADEWFTRKRERP